LVRLPGVHSPISDTWLLAEAARKEGLGGAHVLDLCTGSGALAIYAAQAGAERVVAVDLAPRAVLNASINALINGAQVEVRRGDLFEPVAGERFDVIVSNPPYIPAETDHLPRRGRRLALDGGRDGRILLDRICSGAAGHLNPGGAVLIVHSSICGIPATLEAMRTGGLDACVVVEHQGPLGPVMTARARMMRERGLLGDVDAEVVVVVRGRLAMAEVLASHRDIDIP
jgi:release factor glutamine methyltransferase